MKLSTIIVNWNTKDLLSKCLSSVYEQQIEGGHQIIVVDNASTDGSQQMVAEKFPEVHLLENKVNHGFAAANNQAMRLGEGEYILLLNPDTEVLANAFETMVDFMEEENENGACGARLLNPDGSLQPSCSPEPTLRTEFIRLFHMKGIRPDGYHEMDDWDIHIPRQVDVLLGACLLIRREAMQEVGLLDEDYFMYSEEVDYCQRLRKAGWKISWVPHAQVIHYGGQSTRQVATKMFLCLYEGKIKYFRKHHGWLSALAYKLILFAAGFTRLVTAPLLWLSSSKEREGHKMMINNYSRLLITLPRL
jgi:GT2 family glycosyltransferase